MAGSRALVKKSAIEGMADVLGSVGPTPLERVVGLGLVGTVGLSHERTEAYLAVLEDDETLVVEAVKIGRYRDTCYGGLW